MELFNNECGFIENLLAEAIVLGYQIPDVIILNNMHHLADFSKCGNKIKLINNTFESHNRKFRYSQIKLFNENNIILVNGGYKPYSNEYGYPSIGLDFWDNFLFQEMYQKITYFSNVNFFSDVMPTFDYLLLPGNTAGDMKRHRRFVLDYFVSSEKYKSSLIFLRNHNYPVELNEIESYEQYSHVLKGDEKKNYKWVNILPGYSVSRDHLPHNKMFANTKVNIIMETACYNYENPFLTEKTFKCLLQSRPFVIVGDLGSLRRLQQKGFRTFGELIDESYDLETDIDKRIAMALDAADQLVKEYNNPLVKEICEHNQTHFLNPRRMNKEVNTFVNQIIELDKLL